MVDGCCCHQVEQLVFRNGRSAGKSFGQRVSILVVFIIQFRIEFRVFRLGERSADDWTPCYRLISL